MFDLVLVFFFLLMIYFGWKDGFVKAFMRFFGFFISVAIAYLAYAPVSTWLMTTPLADTIGNFIKKDVIKSGQPSIMLNLPLPEGMKTALQGAVNSGVDSAINDMVLSLTTIFVSLISMVLVFVLAFLAIKILELILNGIVKLPVLSFFNKICGFVMGIINGAICVYLISMLSMALIPFVPWLATMNEQSIIIKLIFLKNI